MKLNIAIRTFHGGVYSTSKIIQESEEKRKRATALRVKKPPHSFRGFAVPFRASCAGHRAKTNTLQAFFLCILLLRNVEREFNLELKFRVFSENKCI